MLERLGRTKEALAALGRVLEIDSRHYAALVSQAVLLSALGQTNDALASCDRALTVRDDDPQISALRTDLLVELGRFDDAAQSHDKSVAKFGVEQPIAPLAPLDRNALVALLGQGDDRSIVGVPWTDGAALLARSAGDLQGHPAAIVLQDVEAADHGAWPGLRAALFAAGYIPLRQTLADGGNSNTIYARSDLLLDVSAAGVVTGPAIGMWNLGNNGRFANQLWQYLFLSMYGLRNGLVVECPPWDGEEYFGFKNPRPRPRRTKEYYSFAGDHLELWRTESPPQDVNFSGYFQEVPDVWRAHRLFIRRFFTLKPAWQTAIDNFQNALRSEGRTLVSIHIRRGDYVTLFQAGKSHFRPIPTNWYRAALSRLWPQLEAPVLHVATDEPALVDAFSDYPQLGDRFAQALSDVPPHVRDFMALRDSQHLLACNSSYSMMAALLASQAQNCLLVDFKREEFVPFDLWSEGRFWNRFV
jgi:tetratricopeptide (TPR) repeat protein